MIRPLAFAAMALALGATPQSTQAAPSTKLADMSAGTYVLDRNHASITARISHFGFSNYTFRFLRFDGAYSFDPAKPAAASLTVNIDPASIDTVTGDDAFGKTFTAQLAGDGWLETARFPTARFVSTAVDIGDGRRGKVAGDLTLHGVTRPIVLDVTFNGSGTAPGAGGLKTGFSATTAIKRSDFGVTKYVPNVGDEVTLNIEVEFAKK